MNLKNYHSTLCTKNWTILKKIHKLKVVNPHTDENKVMKPNVLDNVKDLFNDLYYIYKGKYNEERDGLNTKNKKLFTTKNWDLLVIINTNLKKKKKKKNKNWLVKSLIKKSHLKNQQKMIGLNLINELMKKKEA